MLAPLSQGRGVRIGAVGRTGSGKSFALREVVRLAAPAIDAVFVVDDGEDAADWNGGDCQLRADLADCRERPLVAGRDGGSRVVVLEGNVFARRSQDAEPLATQAWGLAARGFKVALVWDEFKKALGGPQRWADPRGDVPRTFSDGRKPGISAFWGTQFPQEPPREAFGQSDLLLFALDAREVEYLRQRRVVDDRQAEAIVRLQNGEFVARLLGAPWNGTVYRF